MGLRLELQQTRERSLSLLEEKDAEIHKLRSQVRSDYFWHLFDCFCFLHQIELAVEETFYSADRAARERSPAQLPRKISMDTVELCSPGQEPSSGPPLHYLQVRLTCHTVELYS